MPNDAAVQIQGKGDDALDPASEKGGGGTRPLRVLALDGGGIRGVIPATVLAEIENKTGKRIAEMFDLIAGTSTGGILALALATRTQTTHRSRTTRLKSLSACTRRRETRSSASRSVAG